MYKKGKGFSSWNKNRLAKKVFPSTCYFKIHANIKLPMVTSKRLATWNFINYKISAFCPWTFLKRKLYLMWILVASHFPGMARCSTLPSTSVQKHISSYDSFNKLTIAWDLSKPLSRLSQTQKKTYKEDSILDRHISYRQISLSSVNSENAFYTTKALGRTSKTAPFKNFPGFSSTWRSRCLKRKRSTKSYIVAKSKKEKKKVFCLIIRL